MLPSKRANPYGAMVGRAWHLHLLQELAHYCRLQNYRSGSNVAQAVLPRICHIGALAEEEKEKALRKRL